SVKTATVGELTSSGIATCSSNDCCYSLLIWISSMRHSKVELPEIRKIEGFGPPISIEPAIEEKFPVRDIDMRIDERNIPMPNKALFSKDSPIYKSGDKNQAGEGGKAVVINRNELSLTEKRIYDDGFEKNAFNQYVSDMISIHRSLPSYIDEDCKTEKYDSDLPNTSVIICFHNEAWSVLLRTVHSVLERTRENLLAEIILVDDFSDMTHLKADLEIYMRQFPKVRILRLEKREGLIRARIKGAAISKGSVITYLDSHCECLEGWIEPLLDRIKKNPKTVVCPVIDVIDDNTFEYHYSKAYFTNIRNKGEVAGAVIQYCLDGEVGEDIQKVVIAFPCHKSGGNQIRNKGGGSSNCLDWTSRGKRKSAALGLYWCHKKGGNQFWLLSKDGEIRRDESCIDYAGADVMVYPCHGLKGNQEWKYLFYKNQILHVITNKCLEMSRDGTRLIMNVCDQTNPHQQWLVQEFNQTLAKQYKLL
ncbi:glycosyltransferase, group 2 family protein, partial [Onchocerca flexuosa]